MDPPTMEHFDRYTRRDQLAAIYALQLEQRTIAMALQDQITELTGKVATLTATVTTLGEKVDAEQEQVAAAIALLSVDNPDIAAALATLESVNTNLGAITADVESTIPDAPPAP
jgi:hypothetical protein